MPKQDINVSISPLALNKERGRVEVLAGIQTILCYGR